MKIEFKFLSNNESLFDIISETVSNVVTCYNVIVQLHNKIFVTFLIQRF